MAQLITYVGRREVTEERLSRLRFRISRSSFVVMALVASSCGGTSGAPQAFLTVDCPAEVPVRMTGRYSNECIRNVYGDTVALPEFGGPYWPPVYNVAFPRERGGFIGLFVTGTDNPETEIHLRIVHNPSAVPPPLALIATIEGVEVKAVAGLTEDSRRTYYWADNGWFYELDAPAVVPPGTSNVLDVITSMIKTGVTPATFVPGAPR